MRCDVSAKEITGYGTQSKGIAIRSTQYDTTQDKFKLRTVGDYHPLKPLE